MSACLIPTGFVGAGAPQAERASSARAVAHSVTRMVQKAGRQNGGHVDRRVGQAVADGRPGSASMDGGKILLRTTTPAYWGRACAKSGVEWTRPE